MWMAPCAILVPSRYWKTRNNFAQYESSGYFKFNYLYNGVFQMFLTSEQCQIFQLRKRDLQELLQVQLSYKHVRTSVSYLLANSTSTADVHEEQTKNLV